MVLFNNIKRFWRQWHNKTLAIGFISIAFICYLTYFISSEITYNWCLLRTYPGEAWNLFVYLLVYGIILYGNITNNNVAYSGILMFVCMITLSAIRTFIEEYLQTIIINPLFGLLISSITIGSVVFGILYYINIYKYINHRSEDFKKCRAFGIVFASLLFVQSGGLAILIMLIIGSTEFADVIGALLLPFSEAMAAIACIFTVERIKR